MNRTRISGLIAAAAAAVLIPLGSAIPADAANYSIDGKSPVSAGCQADSQTIYKKSFMNGSQEVGYIELRYSVKCHAAWGRMTSIWKYVPGDQHSGGVVIHRNNDGKEYGCRLPANVSHPSCYTKVVYDKGLSAYAEGDLDYYPVKDTWPTIKTKSY